MRFQISREVLAEDWSLSFSDLDFVNTNPASSRLGVAFQLKFFCTNGYFATHGTELPEEAISYLADQLAVRADLGGYDFTGRSARRHSSKILRYLGFRRLKRKDRGALVDWIRQDLCPRGGTVPLMLDAVFLWCRDRQIFASSTKAMERLVRAERQRFMDVFVDRVADRLSPEAAALMQSSLADTDSITAFHAIKGDPGSASLDNMLAQCERLAFIKKLMLPRDMLRGVGQPWINQIVRRVGAEKASEMRRHMPQRQLGLYAVFLMVREAQIIDGMLDLLVETVHRIGVRSRRRVIADIARDIEKVFGKERMLAAIAGAAIEEPDGRVCDVIFPVAGKEKLEAVHKEYWAKETFERRVYQVMRRSYANHYRRILPKLLSVLDFRSNNAVHRPVLDALGSISLALGTGRRFFFRDEVPTEGVIARKWRSAIIGEDGRINCIS